MLCSDSWDRDIILIFLSHTEYAKTRKYYNRKNENKKLNLRASDFRWGFRYLPFGAGYNRILIGIRIPL